MIRDVRAFVNSSMRKQTTAQAAATEWKRFQLGADRLLQDVPRNRIFEIRYEDLARDPSHWLSRLCEFLGANPDLPPTVLDGENHHVIGNHMRLNTSQAIRLDEKWRQTLSQADIDCALRIAGDVNSRFGYE